MMTIAAVDLRGLGLAEHPTGPAGSPGYVSILLLLAAVAIGALVLWQEVRRSDGGADDSDEGGPGGGGWSRGGPTPPCHPPDTDPTWWPEFEREFAAYVNGDRARSGVLVVRDIAIREALYQDVLGKRSQRPASRGYRRRRNGVGVSW